MFFSKKNLPMPPNNDSGSHMLALEPRILFDATGLNAGLGIGPEIFDHTVAEARQSDMLLERSRLLKETIQQEAKETQALFHAIFSDYNPPALSTLPHIHDILFIDAAVTDAEPLLQGLSDRTRVVFLDRDRDGVSQISQTLADEKNLSAIHILSHGGPGRLQLGSGSLSQDNLHYQADEVAHWGEALAKNGDILLYGCNVAAGEEGRTFLASLANLTDADVAGSNDATGAAGRGGDWELELEHGRIESVFPFNEKNRASWDALLGTPELLSVGIDGPPPNADSSRPDISDDGRFVTFASSADNLLAGDNNGKIDVFVKDTETGEIILVSKSSDATPANDDSYLSTISADGRYVAFFSRATNLTDNSNPSVDGAVYWHDVKTGQTQLVSIASDGNAADSHSNTPRISGDGRFVVFHSYASNLGVPETDFSQVFRHHVSTGTTELVSSNSNGESLSDSNAWPMISNDGRYVVFNHEVDTRERSIYWKDMETGILKNVSVDQDGGRGNAMTGNSVQAAVISADGRYVVFQSDASNLTVGDDDARADVFLRDTTEDATKLISTDRDGITLKAYNGKPSISADGRYVVFQSSDELDTFGFIYRYDTQTNQLSEVVHGSNSFAALNRAGDRVVFESKYIPSIDSEPRSFESIYQLDLDGILSNQAPIINDTTPLTQPAITETETNSSGILVSELIGNQITDADMDAQTGIAITNSDDSRGRWQYTIDGHTWIDLQHVSDKNATLLAADANTRVRFIPSSGFDLNNLDQSMADLSMALDIDGLG